MLRKEDPGVPEDDEIRIEAEESFLLPADYCPSVNERLRLYRRLRLASGKSELDEIEAEIVDRFGPAPESAAVLFAVHRFRIGLLGSGVRHVKFGKSSASLVFSDSAPHADRLLELVRKGTVRLAGSDKVSVPLGGEGLLAALGEIAEFVDGLAVRPQASNRR